jgi:hypothetical protein
LQTADLAFDSIPLDSGQPREGIGVCDASSAEIANLDEMAERWLEAVLTKKWSELCPVLKQIARRSTHASIEGP